MRAMLSSRPKQRTLSAVVVAGVSAVAGLVAVANIDHVGPFAKQPFAALSSVPTPIFFAGLGGVVAAIIGRGNSRFALAIFFAWLPVEDLVRKLAGNDLRVYFAKFFLLAVVMIAVTPHLRGHWRRVLGSAWGPTMAVIGYAVVMGIPSGAINPRVPISGIVLRYAFILLLPIGSFISSEPARLRGVLNWLAALCAATSLIGIVQTISPSFLKPPVTPNALFNLDLVRHLAGTSIVVARPSGPFADPGRFASMTTVTIVLGLCVLRIASASRERTFGMAVIVIGFTAAFAAGGRTPLVIAVLTTGFGVATSERRVRTRSLLQLAIAIVAILVVAGASGHLRSLAQNRTSFFAQTLSPTGQNSEISYRGRIWLYGAGAGIRAGGLLGSGTGTQALGRQYLGGDTFDTTSESGWGNVASEGGVIGLGIWVVWVVAWLRRTIRSATVVRGTAEASALPVVAFFNVIVLLLLFTVSGGQFDNYVTNVFFWFLSGISFGLLARHEQQDFEDESCGRNGATDPSPTYQLDSAD